MYIPTIGLEIHMIVKTKTKMFCACPNSFEDGNPNTNVCPICLGHPGTLPVANEEAVRAAVKLGLALNGTIATKSHFDRKSYFYPDLPKGYQISQYDEPFVSKGILNGIRVTRVHLEEDAGRLLHDIAGKKDNATYVDYNRAGSPLLELVTEPDVKNAEEAVSFAKELQRIVRYLGISDADMEKGQMRVEANISISKKTGELGTKVEVKNINSFRAVHDAIEFELVRQEEVLESGGKIVQETRGWNDVKKITESQRSKESAHDYRYFPEPDLAPIDLTLWNIEEMKRELPELPEAKRVRFVEQYGISRELAEALIEQKTWADYFENAASELRTEEKTANISLLANYLMSDLKGILNTKGSDIQDIKITSENFADLVRLVDEGKLSSRLAKDMLVKMFETGEDPEVLMKEGGIRVIGGEDELIPIVQEIVSKNPKAVEDYKNGKMNSVQFLVGQGMARTKGQASPDVLRALFEKKLSE
ncbi:MAG: aspartyl-tRNA(Asn)/glutamyl-tRNA (Gln) amidotransferase subunit B [Parcubacteria group bacterium LiPW_41]|nr:MAG: aspartyl-tRNA(Asn)/glutamyl-tRNA (Gln) amidotransferase subunit B [Parcubacteria group bacterium LiPW_41]